MKFLIAGVTGLRNRGVEALVVTIVDEVRSRFPEATFTLLTGSPDFDGLRLSNRPVETLLEANHLEWHSTTTAHKQKGLLGRLRPPTLEHRRQPSGLVWGSSALIITGGDILSPEYGPDPLKRYLDLSEQALAANRPVLFLGQSMNPFPTSESAARFVEVAQRATLFTAREVVTYRYLVENLKLDPARVHLTADPAFLLRPGGESLYQWYGLEGKSVVALCPSQGVVGYGSGCDPAAHLQSWVALARVALDKLGATVVLVPHVQEIHAHNDDRILATQIARELAFDPRIRLIGGDYDASELKGLLSRCQLVVTERMHAGVAALSSGVAAILVAYSIKSEGLIQRVGGELAENYLISLGDFLNSEKTCLAFEKAWHLRHELAARLAKIQEELSGEARLNFDLLAQCLKPLS